MLAAGTTMLQRNLFFLLFKCPDFQPRKAFAVRFARAYPHSNREDWQTFFFGSIPRARSGTRTDIVFFRLVTANQATNVTAKLGKHF